MRTSCVKNGLAVGVILLFIGIAINPAIAVNPIPSDNEEDCNCNFKFNNILEILENNEELPFFKKSNNINYVRPLCNLLANKALHYFDLIEYYGTQAGNYPPDSPEFEYYYGLGMLCIWLFLFYFFTGVLTLCWAAPPWYGDL